MDSRIESLARLIVEFGANVQPGQIVDVNADLGKEELARAIAAIAYERGAFGELGDLPPSRTPLSDLYAQAVEWATEASGGLPG